MEDLLRQIAGFRAEYERDVLRLAEELRGQRMPELTEELFSEFERNGSRLGYEAAYFGRRKFLSVFGLVCVMGHRAEDIGKLEEILREVCQEECSWRLRPPIPAGREAATTGMPCAVGTSEAQGFIC